MPTDKLRVVTILRNADFLKKYPPFLEKLTEKVHLVLYYFEGSPPESSRIEYKHIPLPIRRGVKGVLLARKLGSQLAEKEKADLVYVLDGFFYELWGYYFSKKAKIPLVIRLRTNEVIHRKIYKSGKLKTWVWHEIRKKVLKSAGALSCISRELVEYAKSIVGESVPVELIYHGVDIDFFKPKKEKEYAPVVCTPQGLKLYKGADMLIEVARRLPDVTFLVTEKPEKKYASVKLPPNLRVLGLLPRSKLPEVYNSASLIFMPSLTEGLPDALLESLACEVPAYASPVGEIPYVLKEGRCGWLIHDYKADHIAESIKKLLADPETLKETGKRGRKFVSRKFKWETFVEKTVKLFETALSRG